MSNKREATFYPFDGPVEAVMSDLTDDRPTEIVHACPPPGSGLMPCCDRTPFQVPFTHRVTLDPNLVTCGTTS